MNDEDLAVEVTHPPGKGELVTARSFEEFFGTQWSPVLALAYSLCGSTGMAADVAQDAFVAAFDRWDHLSNPDGFVRQVVANRSVSALRRAASEAKAVLGLRPEPGVTPTFDPEAEQLWADVRALPKRQSQVIALRYLEGHPIDAIADLLGLSTNTVNTHLKRAKATLAERAKETR